MSTTDESIDLDPPHRMRSTSVSELMRKLTTTSPSDPTDVDAVGLRVPEGGSVVMPPAAPLLCHAGLRPVDLNPGIIP